MRLFWRHGYEGVSVGNLTKEIGVAPPRRNAGIGSQADHYIEGVGR
jgi:hypothetical protein